MRTNTTRKEKEHVEDFADYSQKQYIILRIIDSLDDDSPRRGVNAARVRFMTFLVEKSLLDAGVEYTGFEWVEGETGPFSAGLDRFLAILNMDEDTIQRPETSVLAVSPDEYQLSEAGEEWLSEVSVTGEVKGVIETVLDVHGSDTTRELAVISLNHHRSPGDAATIKRPNKIEPTNYRRKVESVMLRVTAGTLLLAALLIAL